MLLSAMKYIRGYVSVQLTGYAPERFLNLCGNRGILIWDLKPCGEGYCFCISVAGFKGIKPILRKTGTKIKILGRHGMPFAAHRYRRRKVFGMGIFLFGGLLYYLSGFVWNIEVNGNSYLSEETILDFLEEEDSSFGARISDISCAGLEEDLRDRYDEVIWTSIKIFGTKMTVDIQENLLPEEEYVEADDTAYDIVAAKDGIISSIVTRSGMPLAAAGAEVKAGDILVSGRLEIKDDNGETAQYLYSGADADILADVVYSYKDVIGVRYLEEKATGNVMTDYSLQLFELTVKNPFFRVEYEDYSVASNSRQLRLADNFYLPVTLTGITYQEYTKTWKNHTEEEIRQIATKNLANYLSDLEENGIQILGKNVMIEKKGGEYVAEGTIDARESIVSYQPTEIYPDTGEEVQGTDGPD